MPKVGLHCNYWNGTGAEKNPDQLLRLTMQAGADAMDFSTALALQFSRQQRIDYGAKAREAGILLTLNGGCSNADISHADDAICQAGIEACKAAIQAAADLGCRIWSGVIYSKWLAMPEGVLTRDEKSRMWDRAVSSLRTLCSFAAPLGIDICIEVVNRFEAYMINTAEDGLLFASDVGYPNLKLLLDTFHMNIEEDCSADALAQTADANRLGHFHISESNRRLPGLKPSDMRWASIFSALSGSGYNGSIILESMVLSQAPAAHAFRTWRDMTDTPTTANLIAEAQKSICFVRQQLQSHAEENSVHRCSTPLKN